MMRGLVATLVLMSSACGFSGKGDGPDNPAGPDAGKDPSHPGDDAAPTPTPDAPETPTPRHMIVASGTELFEVDLDADTTSSIGVVATAEIDGLAHDGTSLLALDDGGTALLVIDPTNAAILASRPLDLTGVMGMTVIPAGEANSASNVILAASSTTLYRIESGGHVVAIGTFTPSYTFASDLAWVKGAGLFVTLRKGMDVELVQIDPATGKNIAVIDNGFSAVYGLSGFNGRLWAVSAGGYVYAIDIANQSSTIEFSGGPQFTEAAL